MECSVDGCPKKASSIKCGLCAMHRSRLARRGEIGGVEHQRKGCKPRDWTGVTERACSRCHVVKPLDDFHQDRSRRNGRTEQCKACVSEQEKSPEKREQARRLRASQRESLGLRRREVKYSLAAVEGVAKALAYLEQARKELLRRRRVV